MKITTSRWQSILCQLHYNEFYMFEIIFANREKQISKKIMQLWLCDLQEEKKIKYSQGAVVIAHIVRPLTPLYAPVSRRTVFLPVMEIRLALTTSVFANGKTRSGSRHLRRVRRGATRHGALHARRTRVRNRLHRWRRVSLLNSSRI